MESIHWRKSQVTRFHDHVNGEGGKSKFDPLTVTPLSVVAVAVEQKSINLRVIYYHVCQERRISHRVSAIEFLSRFLSKSAWNAGQGNTIPPFVARRETKTIVSADSRYLKIHFTISGTNGSHS